jgi:LPXTG-motif cell wall-anchored protein
LAVAGLLLSAVASGTAGAATPASYTGSASGYALKLSGLGQTFTAGASEATAASTAGTSKATGTGDTVVGNTVVTATNPPGETKPEECAAALPPAPLDAILALGLGCGSASATGSALTTTSTATGKVAGLDVNVNQVIGQLPIPTATVTGAVDTVFQQFCAALPPDVAAALCAVTATVQQVLQSATATKTLAAEIGSSTSGVTVAGNAVTSDSTAQAAVVKVLPSPVLNGQQLTDPFATITVSRANAKVVCDLSSGNAVPSFDPAIVRVKLSAPINSLLNQVGIANPLPIISIPGNPLINGELAPVLNLQNGEFSVTPGTTVVLFPGLPIQTTIKVGSGTAKVNADKSATASADGVSIAAAELAPDPLTGGLLLGLAHAEAAGACVAATADAPPAPVDTPTARELPRTGGSSTPWLPMAGVAALAVAVVTRRALVRSH